MFVSYPVKNAVVKNTNNSFSLNEPCYLRLYTNKLGDRGQRVVAIPRPFKNIWNDRRNRMTLLIYNVQNSLSRYTRQYFVGFYCNFAP